MAFTHLHLHTEYSLLDGANRIAELAQVLKQHGMTACAITDHGNMFGAIDFYKTMKKAGIKPIIGMETYLHAGETIDDKTSNQRWHLNLFAKNQEGYENLMYLSSQAFMHGFYYFPRINKKMLAEHAGGLVCSSACLAGEINWHLNDKEIRRNGRSNAYYGARGYEGAREAALWYQSIFGEDFYLEIMRMGINAQENIDAQILRLGRELGIKVIATNDAHYTFKDRAQAHNIFMAINTKSCVAVNENGERIDGKKGGLQHTMCEIYVKTEEQMRHIFADIPDAIENTQEIVDKCNLELSLGNATPPNFKFAREYASEHGLALPEPDAEFSFSNDDLVFEHMCKLGLKKRLKYIDAAQHSTYRERLEREIEIIKNMRFSGYMMIVHDFIKASKDMGVPVGPGRGSAAGALVSYALEITDIDPIPYNLLFERFLNPERVSMPDIDIDFCQKRRGEAIDYVVSKYGRENVAQVITFGKLLAKGVVRDVARTCGVSVRDADYLAKLIGDELKITLKQAYENNPEIAEFLEELNNRAEYRMLRVHPQDIAGQTKMGDRLWEYSLALEGLNRSAGMHAGGVVISNEPLWKKCPIFKQPDKTALVTQYDKDYLEEVDLIKFDFLGLKTLTLIDHAMKLVQKRYGVEINWKQIDFNDAKVYELIQSGNNLGIFQIESAGMQELARKLKPDCFEDIIAMVALYRPGPMESGMVDDYCDIKHGRKKAHYAFEQLRPILESTHGVIVYQEQVMQLVQLVGGFSLGGADLVRRAMGKKKLEEMVKLKGEYLEGARKNGFDEQKASDLWELILKFAAYGFNKSHSAAYAMVCFQTAYLKAYYEEEFMAALLTSEDKAEKIEQYKEELDRLNIALLAPCVNESIKEFNVVDRPVEGAAGDNCEKSGFSLGAGISPGDNCEKSGFSPAVVAAVSGAGISPGAAASTATATQKAIIYGFGSIKGLGDAPIEAILEARAAGGKFASMADFIERVDAGTMNKKALDAMALTGCFDALGVTRLGVMNASDFILEEFKTKREFSKNVAGEGSLFAAMADELMDFKSKIRLIETKEYDPLEIAVHEKTLMGTYVSVHPMDAFRAQISAIAHFRSSEIAALPQGEYSVFMLGALEEITPRTAKASGRAYMMLRALDMDGGWSMMSFGDAANEQLAAVYRASVREQKKELDLYGFCCTLKIEGERYTIFLNELVRINDALAAAGLGLAEGFDFAADGGFAGAGGAAGAGGFAGAGGSGGASAASGSAAGGKNLLGYEVFRRAADKRGRASTRGRGGFGAAGAEGGGYSGAASGASGGASGGYGAAGGAPRRPRAEPGSEVWQGGAASGGGASACEMAHSAEAAASLAATSAPAAGLSLGAPAAPAGAPAPSAEELREAAEALAAAQNGEPEVIGLNLFALRAELMDELRQLLHEPCEGEERCAVVFEFSCLDPGAAIIDPPAGCELGCAMRSVVDLPPVESSGASDYAAEYYPPDAVPLASTGGSWRGQVSVAGATTGGVAGSASAGASGGASASYQTQPFLLTRSQIEQIQRLLA